MSELSYIRDTMKQNTFYVLAGIVGLIEVGVFWISVEFRMPLLITAVFIAGIVLLYGAHRRITDRQLNERAAFINQKAGMATFMVFWVVFLATSLGSAVMGFGAPRFPHPLPPPNEELGVMNERVRAPKEGLVMPNESVRAPNDGFIRLGYFGYIQLALLFLMFSPLCRVQNLLCSEVRGMGDR